MNHWHALHGKGFMKWIILPIITERENEPGFLKNVGEASKIILVYVVDYERLGDMKTSAVGEKLEGIRTLMTEIRKQVSEISPAAVVDEKIEWGEWAEKLVSLAQMENTDGILMANSVFSHELAGRLREKGLNVAIA